MAAIILPGQYKIQPLGAAEPASMYSDAIACSARIGHESIGVYQSSGVAKPVATASGIKTVFESAGIHGVITHRGDINTYTLIALCHVTHSSTSRQILDDDTFTTGRAFQLRLNPYSLEFIAFNTAGTDYTLTLDTAPIQIKYGSSGCFVTVIARAKAGEIKLNASDIGATGSTSIASIAPLSKTMVVGAVKGNTNLNANTDGVYGYMVVPRFLADSEVAGIIANPWQIFKPKKRVLYSFSSGITVQTLFVVTYPAGTGTPSGAQIVAGQQFSGAAASWADHAEWTGSGQYLEATGLSASTEYDSAAVIYDGATYSNVVEVSGTWTTLSDAINVALTGSSLTASSGSIAAQNSTTLAGASAACQVGTLSVVNTNALTGLQVASAAGTLVVSNSSVLAGQQASTSTGALANAKTFALTGASATTQTGTLTAIVAQSAALTGAQITTSAGTLGSTKTVILTGASVAASAGEVAATAGANVTVSLAGAAVATDVGVFTVARTAAVAGSAATSAAGVLVYTRTAALTGASVTSSVGTLAHERSVGVTGSQVAVGYGTFDVLQSKALTGELVSLSTGSISVVSDTSITVALTGVSASSDTGALGVTGAITIDGETVVAAAGTLKIPPAAGYSLEEILAYVEANLPVPTVTEISDAVWSHSSATDIAIQLAEAWGRLGLDPSKPLISGQTEISFGAIVMALAGNETASTLTRQ